jgi:hypothetical protein
MSFNPKKPGRAGPLPSSALPGLITFLCSVDDVHSALASHQLVGAVARAQGFQRVADFHRRVPKKLPALGAGWKRSRDLCPIRGRRSSLKTNVPNVNNEFCNGLAFIGLLPLARFMLYEDGETGPRSIRLSPPDRRLQAHHGNREVIFDRGKRELAILCRLRRPAVHVAG